MKDKPDHNLKVILGGDLSTKVSWSILEEIAQPRPLDKQRIAELEALRAKRGKLRLVKR